MDVWGEIKRIAKKFSNSTFETLTDKLRFSDIFLVYAIVIVFFGMMYHIFSSPYGRLIFLPDRILVTDVWDAVYFSFITATTTGFGDIIPLGIFKFLAVLEVVCGLLLLAVVTSKLVSLKQDVILSETYEISFKERINRLRSSMYLFRQNIMRFVEKLDEAPLSRREIKDLYLYVAPLQDTLSETRSLIARSKRQNFVNALDSLSAELLLDSVLSSLARLEELISSLNNEKLVWQSTTLRTALDNILQLSETVVDRLSQTELSEQSQENFLRRKKEVHAMLKKGMVLGDKIADKQQEKKRPKTSSKKRTKKK